MATDSTLRTVNRRAFVTGFPGFIAKRLFARLVQRDPKLGFTFLVQSHMKDAAQAALTELAADSEGLEDRCSIVAGDITKRFLGLDGDTYGTEIARTTHVWHLAANYDLSVPEAVAYRVNVVGTANVLDFCEACSDLERLDYVSTCYVSGSRTGVVLEAELDENQTFKNHYESTKCWAEIEVRRRMYRLPTAIHRPSIVVGDSRTGETDKYDGPYFVITLLQRLPKWFPMVNIGAGSARPNYVPVDFLTTAMAEIFFNEDTIGKTFQIADPNPKPSRDMVLALYRLMGRPNPLTTVSGGLVQSALKIGSVRDMVRIPREAVTYFNHDVTYDSANTQALLEGTDVRCPDFMSILPHMVEYVRANPDKSFLDGRRF
jgi:thioester reductase-like protein